MTEPATERELSTGVQFEAGQINRFLGVTLLDPARPSAGAHFTVTEHLEGREGALHGGVIPLLLDGVALLALTPSLGPQEDALSHDLHFSLLRGVRSGEVVELRGRVVKKGRSVAFLDAEARVGDTVVATGRITKSIISRTR